jgi:peptidoglycan/xylan/chitin deacetylase (PgdA/CDA1 family)
MPPKQDPVPRARSAAHWLGGILLLGILGAGVVAAAAALWENVDVQSLARRAAAVSDEPPSPGIEPEGPVAAAAVQIRVAVFESAASGAYFPDSTFYPAALAGWERLARQEAPAVSRVRDARGIDDLPAGSLLLAPEAVCLSEGEIAAIQRHLQKGGGLVLNWATAARDEDCRWRGWEPLRQLTGALDLAEFPAGDAQFLAVPAALPVSLGLPPGARIELFPEPHVALQVSGPHPYWSDWALNGAAQDGAPAPDAAIVMHEPDSGGRVVWFGFRSRQAVADLDAERIRRLFRNGIRWASGTVMVEIAPWPAGARAALLVSEDVETGFENVVAFARELRVRDARGTIFPVSELALEHPGIAAAVADIGEVGSQTADHVSPAGLPVKEQEIRLARSLRELEQWSSSEVVGLRVPEERFDEATLQAWRRAGGRYVAALNQARSAAPEVFTTDDGPVVVLPRLLKDDYNVFVQDGARRTDRLLGAWREGLDKIGALGGFGLISVHSQIAGSPDRVGVVGELIDSTADEEMDWWMATGAEIADWWLARSGTRLQLTGPPDSLSLRLVTPPSPTLAAAWLEVHLGPDSELRPFVYGRPLAWAPTEWGIRIPVEELTTGGTDEIQLVPPPDESDELDSDAPGLSLP